jgi:aspartate racemase
VRRIGLLGGTSWESSAHYYSMLNEGVRDRLGGSHSADLVLRSVDFVEIEELQEAGDWAALGQRYEAEARSLVAAGAEVIAICANSMHLVYDDVVRGAGPGVTVVHVAEAVAGRAAAMGLTAVALLGTRYVMDSADLYPPRLAAHGIRTLLPACDDAEEVHRTIYAELVRGQVLDASLQRHRRIIARLADAGAQAVVLGCTEQAMLLDPDDEGTARVPLLDSTSIHVQAVLEAATAPLSVPMEEGAA